MIESNIPKFHYLIKNQEEFYNLFTSEDRYSRIYNKVKSYFKEDKKTYAWFTTENPLLGDIRPLDLMMLRFHKLENFIDDSLGGNLSE